MASIDSTITIRFDDEDRKLLRDLCNKLDLLGSRIAVTSDSLSLDRVKKALDVDGKELLKEMS